MDQSESQFQELLAHLLTRADTVLEKSDQFPPLALALTKAGSVDISVGAGDTSDLGEILNAMQQRLTARARKSEVVATCIAYANYAETCIEACLENNENYCATVKIPVISTDRLKLDHDSLAIEDGNVYVFPIIDDS